MKFIYLFTSLKYLHIFDGVHFVQLCNRTMQQSRTAQKNTFKRSQYLMADVSLQLWWPKDISKSAFAGTDQILLDHNILVREKKLKPKKNPIPQETEEPLGRKAFL